MSLGRAAAASETENEPLLERYLARHRTAAAVEPYMGAFVGTAGVVGVTAALGFSEGDPSPQAWRYAGAASIAVVGGFGSYLLPEDYQSGAAVASIDFTAGALWLALAKAPRTEPATATASALTGAAALAEGGILVTDMLIERPVSERTLMRHHAALVSGDTSAERIAEAERDFRRTNRPVPSWVGALPFVVAGVGSTIRASQPGLTDGDRALALTIGATDAVLGMMPFTIAMLSSRPYDEYLGESLRLAPTGPSGSLGATLVGRF
jgi:hypothetical protein